MNKINIYDQLIYFQKNIRDEEDAYNLYKGLYSTCLINSLENKNFKEFFNLENWGLEKLVKIFDKQNHYNKCLKIFDDIIDNAFKNKIFKSVTPKKYNNKIAFYIVNLANILAHVEVFLNFLENIDQDKFSKCHVDIFTITDPEKVNVKIKNLCKVLNINIFFFNKKDLYASYQSIINFYIENSYKNLIFVSTITGMSFLSKSLPGNVSHYAQKYIINSMNASLKNIYSYNSSGTVDFFNNKKIFYSKFKVNLDTTLINCNFENKKIKFYTINREEKIRDGFFLNCVKEILEKFPESTFSWTGKKKIEFIENFFKQHNLEQRVFFLNWIDIDKFGLKHGDIFLDTTNLSGLIASKSFGSGIPTIFFNNSTFWLNSFIDEIKNDDSYSFIEQEIINDWYKNLEDYKSSYLNIVSKISTIENYFNNYINLSIKLSKKYFSSLRSKKEANLLFENMIT
jgi:hypothetical protein